MKQTVKYLKNIKYAYIQLFMIALLVHVTFTQTITNFQQKIENGRIVVTYDLDGNPGEIYNINITAEKEGNVISPMVLAGDITNVSPGNNKVIWWEPILESRSLKDWHITLTVVEKTLFNMVFIPGGTFEMGCGSWTSRCNNDEKPVHTVTVSSFYMSSTEVTQKLWVSIMGTNPSYFKGEDLPVESVSWNNIQGFLIKLNQQTGQRYRLPTEAEWEYAARSGGMKEKYSGTSSNLSGYIWFKDNSKMKTHPVGEKLPNGLGLYDMSGNVWEWCADKYDSGYYKSSPTEDPFGAHRGLFCVLRGGSWGSLDYDCRSSNRRGAFRADRGSNSGFRIARDN